MILSNYFIFTTHELTCQLDLALRCWMVFFGLFHQHLAHLCPVAHFQLRNRFKRGSTLKVLVGMSDFARFLRKTYPDQSDNDSQQNQFVVIPVLYFVFASCHKFLIFTRSLRTSKTYSVKQEPFEWRTDYGRDHTLRKGDSEALFLQILVIFLSK